MSNENMNLSLVIPAYNEAARLPRFLESVREYLVAHYPESHEAIVVDDGSSDNLEPILQQFAVGWPQLRWIRHAQNQGKGAAVRTGVAASRGRLVLFADADGATAISEEARLAAAIHAGADVAIGSRLAATDHARRSRTWLRGLAGRCFAALARQMLRLPIRDTQCGFKMFRGEAGRQLFAEVHEQGYLFDLELLALASRLGYQIAEIPVTWTEIPGSHLSLSRDFLRILVNLWRLRARLARMAPRLAV